MNVSGSILLLWFYLMNCYTCGMPVYEFLLLVGFVLLRENSDSELSRASTLEALMTF